MIWFKGLTGLAAVLALTALPATASAQSRPPAGIEAQADDLTAWLAKVAAVGEQTNGLLSRRVDTLVWLMEQPSQLLNLLDAGDKPGATAWARTWAGQARARLAGEIEDYKRLPSELPPLPASIPLTPAQATRLEAMSRLPTRIGDLLITTGESAEAYIGLVEAAASGEPDDLRRLAKGVMTLISAQLEAENVMLDGVRIDPTSPNHHFATAQIESNSALIVLMRHQQALLLDQASDGTQAAARIRGHAAAVRQAVVDMRRTIEGFQRRLASEPGFAATDLAATFDAVFASFRESATVEGQLANELDVLALAVERGDETGQEASAARIEVLINRRIELDGNRRRLLAG